MIHYPAASAASWPAKLVTKLFRLVMSLTSLNSLSVIAVAGEASTVPEMNGVFRGQPDRGALELRGHRVGVGAEEAFAVKMDQVVGRFADPDLRLP